MNIIEKMHYIFTHEYDNEDEVDEIITAYETMEAELERLRWHYPDKGEFPNEGDEIIAELEDGVHIYYLLLLVVEHDNLWHEFMDKFILRESIKRWRYI